MSHPLFTTGTFPNYGFYPDPYSKDLQIKPMEGQRVSQPIPVPRFYGEIPQPPERMDFEHLNVEKKNKKPKDQMVGNLFGNAGITAPIFKKKTNFIAIFNVGKKNQLHHQFTIIGFRVLFLSWSQNVPPTISTNSGLMYLDCPELCCTQTQSQVYGNYRNIIAAWNFSPGVTSGTLVTEIGRKMYLNQPTELTHLSIDLYTGATGPLSFVDANLVSVAIEFFLPN